MCIVVCKPKNIKLPSKEVLKRCFDYNSDGAGYMFAKDGVVNIRKGFMTFNAFYKALLRDYKKELAFVLHFRIGTMGENVPELTHPYPMSRNMDELRKTETQCKLGVAHNGIISLTSEYGYSHAEGKINYNDTMKFITDYMSLIIKTPTFYKDEDKIELIEKLVGGSNKFAILDGDGHITTIGHFIEEDCIKYSNTSYEYYSTRKDWEKIFDLYDKAWNAETETYQFEPDKCPLTEMGENCFCDLCDGYLNKTCPYWEYPDNEK